MQGLYNEIKLNSIVELLIDKNIITKEELINKEKEIINKLLKEVENKNGTNSTKRKKENKRI